MSSQYSSATERSTTPASEYTLYSEEVPEFWIYDNHRKNLEGNQEFTITVKRRSQQSDDGDYVRIQLLEWCTQHMPAQFAPTRPTKLVGSVTKRWYGNMSITFDDLAVACPGLYRLRVEVMRYRGGYGRDAVLETLISNDLDWPDTDPFEMPDDCGSH
ncbi:hypothetical protein F4781DRAFT_442302 [Annulohypoxylon bovei var. microspora]|nr:hypothetical protein F4781DRAFT_442302 [Annulohypoxylon bovei var. microspora]